MEIERVCSSRNVFVADPALCSKYKKLKRIYKVKVVVQKKIYIR